MSNTFQDPARLFLENHSVDSLTDIFVYADFLRQEAGLSCDPPISVGSILNHFDILEPEFIDLPQQQGTTINKEDSIRFLINAGDSLRRQKFSMAHELIELLFTAIPGEIRRDRLKENISMIILMLGRRVFLLK